MLKINHLTISIFTAITSLIMPSDTVMASLLNRNLSSDIIPITKDYLTENKQVNHQAIRRLVNDYFYEIIKGRTGQRFFCDDESVMTFFSPRKVEILNITNWPSQKGALVGVRIHASNRRGMPVVFDQWISLAYEANLFCISYIFDKNHLD